MNSQRNESKLGLCFSFLLGQVRKSKNKKKSRKSETFFFFTLKFSPSIQVNPNSNSFFNSDRSKKKKKKVTKKRPRLESECETLKQAYYNTLPVLAFQQQNFREKRRRLRIAGKTSHKKTSAFRITKTVFEREEEKQKLWRFKNFDCSRNE